MRKLLFFFTTAQLTFAQQIPLPEHPRPDFERSEWLNLNGQWAFEFDSLNIGLTQNWGRHMQIFENINVPFPGFQALRRERQADMARYQKEITVPAAWTGKRCSLPSELPIGKLPFGLTENSRQASGWLYTI
ncbi:MAG: hypothetical protein IPO04_14475 [Cytophagaceae bacterium]|nr:hypothetical protein [Cytophagaceae bacterium]